MQTWTTASFRNLYINHLCESNSKEEEEFQERVAALKKKFRENKFFAMPST